MSAPTAHSSGFRFSLRHFLLLVAALAIALAALKFANEWWIVVLSGGMILLVMAMLVVALVDRGPRQAFAIGFVACAAIYAGLVLSGRETTGVSGMTRTQNRELDPYDGRLPTTRLMRGVFEMTSQNLYQNVDTGERLLHSQMPGDYEMDRSPQFGGGGFSVDVAIEAGESAAAAGGLPRFRLLGEFPQRAHFFQIAHLLWGLLLGYAGGQFARFVYARRMRESRSHGQSVG